MPPTLVIATPSDESDYKRKYRALKKLVYELEDASLHRIESSRVQSQSAEEEVGAEAYYHNQYSSTSNPAPPGPSSQASNSQSHPPSQAESRANPHISVSPTALPASQTANGNGHTNDDITGLAQRSTSPQKVPSRGADGNKDELMDD
ncbi:hypothetical protein P7C73_g1871, partial [Tremellales sp. Uapishka_1]